jgi:hypothetical protein
MKTTAFIMWVWKEKSLQEENQRKKINKNMIFRMFMLYVENIKEYFKNGPSLIS